VQGNIVGLDVTGKVAMGNAEDGIDCSRGSVSTTVAWNTVSDNNGDGVFLFHSHNSVLQGNIIGLDAAGKVAVGNALQGMRFSSCDNATIVNNTVSGNQGAGVTLISCRNSVVQGNIIGLDLAGIVARGNAGYGISCFTGSDNTTIANNTISGNRDSGVLVFSSNNVVQGNVIGLGVAGKVALGNGQDGIYCTTGSENTNISGNTVSNNLGNGISIFESVGIRIEANRLENNSLNAVQCNAGSNLVSIINNTFSARFRPGSVGINISSEGTRALANTFSNITSSADSLLRSSVNGMPVLSVVKVSRSVLEGKKLNCWPCGFSPWLARFRLVIYRCLFD
jgi:parallel beta-helix repeat protein